MGSHHWSGGVEVCRTGSARIGRQINVTIKSDG